ncbi:uncharacterized protein [Cicer arietinum]|uniref:Uncharacterized protein LOC101494494 isoform X1 n=1 Tax=Cicer arietinum TaxID=3827 RepID=A0A1S2YB11_CICAR|nr:uncharacterized protein LOC101494494 isoform X1 [Cicer arietinum]
MSMDSLLLPVTQPPPEISDEKQLKSVPDKLSELVLEPYIASDTESEYESESESESESEVVPEQEQELLPEQDPELVAEQEPESESEPELDPRADWELIPIEKLTVNDLASRYEDDPSLFSFGCPQFVYKNKAFLKREEDIKKARAEYYKLARGVSPFDAIPIPPLAFADRCGCNLPSPVELTEQRRHLLTHLSNLALEMFNAKNQGSNFVFDELVKAAYSAFPPTYYITFKANDADHPQPSDSPATTFQAQLWNMVARKGPYMVKSCSIKT